LPVVILALQVTVLLSFLDFIEL